MWLSAVVLVGSALLVFATLLVLRLLGLLTRSARKDRRRQAARRLAEIMTATARNGATARPFILSGRRQRRYERVALDMIDDVEGPERTALVRALGQLGTREKALDKLTAPEVPTRLFAVRTLGLFRDDASHDGLMAALGDPVLSVRLAAASQLLGQGYTPDELDLATRLMRSQDGQVSMPANDSDGLSVTDINLVAQQVFASDDDSYDGRASDVDRDLKARLSHADWQVRVAAARSVGPETDESTRTALHDMRTDPIWPVRAAATATLARIEHVADAE